MVFFRGIMAFLDFRALHVHSAIIFISIGAVHIGGLMAVGGGEFVIERV